MKKYAIRDNKVIVVETIRETKRGTAHHCKTTDNMPIVISNKKLYDTIESALCALKNKQIKKQKDFAYSEKKLDEFIEKNKGAIK